MARISSGADAFDRHVVALLAAEQSIRIVFVGIIGRAAGDDSDVMALRERFCHEQRPFWR